MKQFVFLTIIIKCFFLCSCSNVDEVVDYSVEYAEFNDSTLECISEEVVPNLKIHEGYVSQQAETIRVLRNGVTVAIVKLSAPVIVAQADEKETWGYFQFPIIYKEDNKLIIDWEMREDSYSGYGIDSHGRMMSVDNGKTWTPLDENYYRKERYGIELNNGNLLQVKDVSATSIDNYLVFPQPVNSETING